MGSVWIAGSYQSDFTWNYAREGLEISDMMAEAVAGTLNQAGVAAEAFQDGDEIVVDGFFQGCPEPDPKPTPGRTARRRRCSGSWPRTSCRPGCTGGG